MEKFRKNKQPRLVFFGTPEFSAIILRHLIDAGFPPAAVVTIADKPVGRKQILTPSPAKALAGKHSIQVLQPAKLKDASFLDSLQDLHADVFIIASYGKILPQELLDIPPKGTLNVHPSLLPKYRGPSPIQTAILNGDTETGVTLMLTDAEMDHGSTIANGKWRIADGSTYTTLHNELAEMGGKLLVETLPKWIAGEITPREQDHTKATFTKLLTKEDGHIDWSKPAIEIERQIRAFEVWPGTWTELKQGGKSIRIKILTAHVLEEHSTPPPGTITKTKSGDLAVATKDSFIIIEALQPEGKKYMTGKSLLNGQPLVVGCRLSI